MPRLSDSMEEGTVLQWLKQSGDEVKRGEPLVEIETDKANMVYDAVDEGTLEIVASEGATLPIGAVIGHIGGAVGGAATEVAARGSCHRSDSSCSQAAREESAPAPPARSASVRSGAGDRVKASPVARRMAAEHGIDLATIQGSGPGGRIVKADIAGATNGAGQVSIGDSPAQVESMKGEVRVEELSRTQQTIARRMAESRATVPDFSVRVEIEMERAVELRAQLADASADIAAPSLNDLVVKACALALRDFPRVNSAYRDGHFEFYSRINVGVAVATDDALVVPTIFDADHQSLHEIAAVTQALVERARSGEITPPELSGGTFTVSNLGMFGVDEFTAVINPPQAAILTVGAVKQRPVVAEGELVARHTAQLELACDHRILYGAESARFLQRLRELLEHPAGLT